MNLSMFSLIFVLAFFDSLTWNQKDSMGNLRKDMGSDFKKGYGGHFLLYCCKSSDFLERPPSSDDEQTPIPPNKDCMPSW